MADYKVKLKKSVEGQLEALPIKQRIKMMESIGNLWHNPYPTGHKKLKKFDIFKDWVHDYYRIKVGVYRAIYRIEKVIQIVMVMRVKHRKDVYNP